MTDRELLALAAQSAGFSGFIFEDGRYWIDGPMTDAGIYPQQWNPLADDGDALRLAVNLNIHISPNKMFVEAKHFDGTAWHCFSELVETSFDPMPTTRRAIVIVAASIGRVQPTPTTPTGDH